MTTRSVRLRHPKQPFTPTRDVVDHVHTNYNVNKQKALQQKLDATSRQHVTASLKKGNLVLTFSTASLEVFRSVLRDIMNANPFDGTKWILGQRMTRNGSATAEESISVVTGNKQIYRINLYLTTSRVNINGSKLNIFIKDHLTVILDMMTKIGKFTEINEKLKLQLDSILNNIDNHPSNQPSHKLVHSDTVWDNNASCSNGNATISSDLSPSRYIVDTCTTLSMVLSNGNANVQDLDNPTTPPSHR